MKIFGITIPFTAPNVSSDVAAVKTFALNELDMAVQAAKQTPLGTAVTNIISSVENKGLTGPQKLAQAITAAAPVIVDWAERGGYKAVIADAETFANHMIESILADIKQTGAFSIGKAILTLLKKL